MEEDFYALLIQKLVQKLGSLDGPAMFKLLSKLNVDFERMSICEGTLSIPSSYVENFNDFQNELDTLSKADRSFPCSMSLAGDEITIHTETIKAGSNQKNL